MGRIQRTCVCGHVAVHHDQRKSIPQGLMADYKVIWACGWTGCGCPRFVETAAPLTGGSTPEPDSGPTYNDPTSPDSRPDASVSKQNSR